jgi:hypothetical protein
MILYGSQLSAANQRCRMRTGLNKIRHEFSGRSHNRVFQQYRPKAAAQAFWARMTATDRKPTLRNREVVELLQPNYQSDT